MFTVSSLVVVLALVVFLFFARRILRLAVRLVLVGVVLLALLAAVAFGWWEGWFGSSQSDRPAASQPRHPETRRGNSR
jgi:hypothetical protein